MSFLARFFRKPQRSGPIRFMSESQFREMCAHPKPPVRESPDAKLEARAARVGRTVGELCSLGFTHAQIRDWNAITLAIEVSKAERDRRECGVVEPKPDFVQAAKPEPVVKFIEVGG